MWKRKEIQQEGSQNRILIRVISASHYFLEASNGHIYSEEMPRVRLDGAALGGEEGKGVCPLSLEEVMGDPISSAWLIPFHGAHSLPLSLFGC